MKAFSCRVCDATLYFENFACVRCQTKLGYSRDERAVVPLSDDNVYVDSIGKGPLYPFVIPDHVIDKLEFVASIRPTAT